MPQTRDFINIFRHAFVYIEILNRNYYTCPNSPSLLSTAKNMKKLAYLPLLTLLFISCQKQNYGTLIPAPKFSYYSSESVTKQISEPTFETSTSKALPSETTAFTTPSFVLPAAESSSVSTVEPQILTTKATSLGAKTFLKQRVVKRFMERRITKMSSQQNSKPKANRADGIAVTSFIAAIIGIVGLFTTGWLFLIGMVAAIVLGFVGLSRIRHSNGELGGRGWALAGLILGFIELLLLILGVLFVAALFGAFGA